MRVLHATDAHSSAAGAGIAAAAASTYLPTLPAATESAETHPDRRDSERIRTVYRVVPVSVGDNQGLARIRNISDGGMKLNLLLPVFLGDRVRVALSELLSFYGTVVWAKGDECGLKFDEPINSIVALRASCEEARAHDARPPRLPVEVKAVAVGDHGPQEVTVRDISQRGMKIAHDGRFEPGMNIKVKLPSGVEKPGVVRWSDGKIAGVMLSEIFSPQELGNIATL